MGLLLGGAPLHLASATAADRVAAGWKWWAAHEARPRGGFLGVVATAGAHPAYFSLLLRRTGVIRTKLVPYAVQS